MFKEAFPRFQESRNSHLTSSGGQWNLSTLHAFTGGSDGASPVEGVIVDKTGVVYGTATGGGKGKCLFGSTTGCGTLYRITPTVNGRWNFELLYSRGTADGKPLHVFHTNVGVKLVGSDKWIEAQ
jgi:hypothetical protein